MPKRYQNPYIRKLKRTPFHFLGWLCGVYQNTTKTQKLLDSFSYPIPDFELNPDEPTVQWINHCTFLLEIDGLKILTDPIWSDRCSPFPFFGPKRRHSPPIELEDLPDIDVVLISHNHYDHLDARTVSFLKRRFPKLKWYAPKGLGAWFRRRGIQNLTELDWWQESSIDTRRSDLAVVVTAVPAQHNSGRGIFDSNSSLWVGYVLTIYRPCSEIKKAYFVGDTAYNEHDFKKIGRHFKSIDLALTPIGTYEPSDFMKTVHSGPVEAVSIHEDVNSQLSVAMHWRTFKLSSEPMHLPPYDLYHEMLSRNLNPARFLAIDPGMKINW